MQKSWQSRSGGPIDISDLMDDEVVCDTCGDLGLGHLLVICNKCTDGAEHTYCMGVKMDEVPEDGWTCQECTSRAWTNQLVQDTYTYVEATNRPRRQSGKSSKLQYLRSSYFGICETRTSYKPARRSLVPSKTQTIKQAGDVVTGAVHHNSSEPSNESPHQKDFSFKKSRKVKSRSINKLVYGSQYSCNPKEKAKVPRGCGDKRNAGTLETEIGKKGRTLETRIQSPKASTPRNYSLRSREHPLKNLGKIKLEGASSGTSLKQSLYDTKETAKSPYYLRGESLKLGSQMKIAQEECSLMETNSFGASNLKLKGQVAKNGYFQTGSLSASCTKRSSSSEDNYKPPSLKRQKVDNSGTSEKLMPVADSSKEMCTPAEPVSDPVEFGSSGAQIAGAGGAADGVSFGTGDRRNDHRTVASSILFNSVISDKIEIETLFPASIKIDYAWQGKFLIQSSEGIAHVCNGIQAHLSTGASPKVLEVVEKLLEIIVLEELPRAKVWPSQFLESQATEENIALYIFAEDPLSYRTYYKRLMDYMIENDLSLKGIVDGAELLIFPSTVLPEKSQLWNGMLFLWGVFRGRREDNSANTQLENGDTANSGACDLNFHPEDVNDNEGEENTGGEMIPDLNLSPGPEDATGDSGSQPSTALTLAPPSHLDLDELQVVRALVQLSMG